ncbi:extracellular solute-binding protein [Clostridium estertheticum]|uniref:extracellular solute-binding protein n=1 Tax=Clostridium estertheticum TaxID=238834 RepID=UPI0013E93495|nr:extracellular solute-binding protein [Clostridium estertheticum]MBZ9687209.1 extracellular solute-binding protein [Clostridium estertheticum]
MNKLLKRTFTGLLTASLLVTLVGCGKSNSNATKDATVVKDTQITLNVWHQWSNDSNDLKKIYDAAVLKYQTEHKNVTIKTDTLDTEAYKTKINTAFAGNTSAVDVFYYLGGGKARKLAESGKLLPLDEYVKDGTLDKIIPGSTTAFQYNQKTYSLPMFSWNMVLYCNKELFDKNGVKIPTTYDELLDASKKLSAKGVLPLVVGAKDGWNAAFVYEALALREVGAEKINAVLSGSAAFDDPGFAEAARKLSELSAAGAFGKSPLATSHDEADATFIAGKAAMRLMGSWLAGNVYTNKDTAVKDKIVAAKIPMSSGKGNTDEFAGGFIESFWVNANTKYKDESVQFTKYINEAMGKGAAENSLGFSGWKGEIDNSKLNPLTIQIAEQVKTSKASVLAWDTSLDEAPTTAHLEAVQALFNSKITPKEFMKIHQEALQK